MSKQATFVSPASPAAKRAPATPPAGPERTVRAAWAPARAGPVSPPEDCMICGSLSPILAASTHRRSRYEPSSGESAASSAVVAVRSYSRNVPTSSLESDSGTPGSSSPRSSPRSRSWRGSA